MLARLLSAALLIVAGGFGQTICEPVQIYTPCDIVFEMTEAESTAHPNPYLSLEVVAEIRSPGYRTIMMPGFWDGGRRVVVRFAPTEPGDYTFRMTSNVAGINGKQGTAIGLPSDTPGFIKPANVHHWSYTENFVPHLWMGDTLYPMATIDRSVFNAVVDTRAEQKFNHIRGLVLGWEADAGKVFASPDQIDTGHFQELDSRIRYMNERGIIADLVVAGDENHLVKLFPNARQRERYIRYLIGRYAAMNITWQGVQEFEEYENGRAILKEIGTLIRKLDPYNHPRSSHTVTTAGPLLGDGWMTHVMYQSADDQLGSIERQLFAVPLVNAEFAYEDSGAGKSHQHHVDSDIFRKRLWNSTMNGQYPTFGNTGTYGGRKFAVNPEYLDSPGARQMTRWHDFFARTRHWELQPYFDVDGGRAVFLDDVEYIVYVENPQPVEIILRKQRWDISWFNPITGESVKLREFRGDRWSGEPPTNDQDWVLHISRERRKDGMLRSYKFESRPVLMQEVESNLKLIPFEIEAPSGDTIMASAPPPFAVKITRDSRATRNMKFLWTGEVTTEGQGYRVAGTGQEGNMRIPPGLARKYPAVLNIRVFGMNSVGKIYSLDRVYRLTQ